jgi:hypothetical protein
MFWTLTVKIRISFSIVSLYQAQEISSNKSGRCLFTYLIHTISFLKHGVN